ncbi:hypothetical protein GQX73_g7414 [Xylaria multiplex]|uniref:Radical SAM core domain-containing protein n=1 Tax=Xylaria multiplex TaxID=323545 RepID=A0A7C8IL07_9PEZI|nr:hypothetical protein GQX73_g7414 [Xylaria multiplex]
MILVISAWSLWVAAICTGLISVGVYFVYWKHHNGKVTIPVSVNYHFTRKCNKECAFCFHTEKTSHVASEDEMKRGLRLLKVAGMRKINFAGGEPFLYPRKLAMLCRFCKEDLGLESVSIITNGTKVDKKWMKEHGQWVDVLGVSCDSFNEETNTAIGRGTGNNVKQLFDIRDWCRELGIKFKLNTVVCIHNWEENMVDMIQKLDPFRWKVFQVLYVEGENDAQDKDVSLDKRKRNAKNLLISDKQFRAFCDQHQHLNSFVPEPNSVMASSYLLLDEYLCFLDKGSGAEKQSRSILDVGVQKALGEIYWDQEAFSKRGGMYDWTKDAVGEKSEGACSLADEKLSCLLRWKWELLWMFLSLTSLATSIALLAVQDGRRLDSWTAFFTLNTFISILAQVSRTTLAFGISSSLGQAKWNIFSTGSGSLVLFDAFDEASKGPWGSVGLVCRLRLRHIATLGAVIIITLLSYEPFLQATITQYGELYGEYSGLGSEATIGRAQKVDVGIFSKLSTTDNPILTDSGILLPTWSMQADYGLTTSIYNGFYTSTVQNAQASFSCPTGNCTFGTFTSLGVCSVCVDVSAHLISEHRSGWIPGTAVGPPGHNLNHTYTSYTLPGQSNLTISNYDGIRNTIDGVSDWVGSGSVIYQSETLSTIQATVFPQNTIHFSNTTNSTTFVVFQIIQSRPDFLNNVSDWGTTLPVATECGLYFCAKMYSSSVVEGKLQENVTATWSNRDPISYKAQDVGRQITTDQWDQVHNYTLYIGSQDYVRSDLQVFIPEDEAMRTTMNWITTKFAPGQINLPGKATYNVSSGVVNDGPGQVIGDSRDLNDTFSAVASSMTVYMRNTGLESIPQYGTTQTWVLYFQIRWIFLAPPLVLTVAGSLFLLYTIWETQSLGLVAWKESTLATLAHGLDVLTRAKLRDAYQDGTEEKCAREITARVEKSWGGLELCETYPASER